MTIFNLLEVPVRMKIKKVATLVSTMLLVFSATLPTSVALASELDMQTEYVGEIQNTEIIPYMSLQYDGSEQVVHLSEETELHLLGWKDETKSQIIGKVKIIDANSQMLETEMDIDVNNERKEYVINEEQSIYLSANQAEVFAFQEYVPTENPIEEYKTIETDEKGKMRLQLVLVDEFGTIIEWQNHYKFLDASGEEITEEQYLLVDEEIEQVEIIEETPEVLQEDEVSEEIIEEEKTEEVSAEVIEEVETFSMARQATQQPSVVYSTHVQSKGWLPDVKNGLTTGTSGESKRIEALKVRIDGIKDLGVSYSTHVQSYGWLSPVSNYTMSGVEGESKRIEAIKINLTGAQAKNYDIYYRVHAEKFGWLDWAKNGQSAGTEGMARRVEAIEIKVVGKGGGAPTNTQNHFVETPHVAYTSYVGNTGWQNNVTNGAISGTEGVQKRIEAIKLGITTNSGLSVRYSAHLQKNGWMNWSPDNVINGLPGEGKRLEALKLELTGVNAGYFDIYYRVHSQKFGWLGWARNGEPAGTEGYGYRLEAYQVKVVPKGTWFNRGDKAFAKKDKTSVVYSTHVQKLGWLEPSKDGAINGTQERSLRLEALTIALNHDRYSGNITYSTHVQKNGWINPVSNGAVSGTTGEAKRLEALKINLDGEIAQYYDVYYRTYVQTFGWLGWAKNGMPAGSEGLGKRLESVEIKLIEKGHPAPKVSAEESFKHRKTVFLDIGHGGADPGAQYYGTKEKDLNLQIGRRIQRDLEKAGFAVIMSRTADTYMDFKTERSRVANNSGADIFISLHNNAMPGNGYVNGIETFYYEYDPDYEPKINKEMHNDPMRIVKSGVLAKAIHNNLIDYTGAYDRGVRRETFAVLRETALPAVLLEFGFMSNLNELQKLKSEAYQNKLSHAVSNGVKSYFTTY